MEDCYTLTVQVKYDFLPTIEETVRFTDRKVSDTEMSELEIKNYFHEIQDLNKKVNEVANCQVFSVDINEKPKDFAIDFPKSKTLLTWSLQARSCSNSIKLQIYFVNTQTGSEKKSKFVPNDTICVHAPSGTASAEMRFVVEPTEGYDKLVFRIESNIKGKYNVILESI